MGLIQPEMRYPLLKTIGISLFMLTTQVYFVPRHLLLIIIKRPKNQKNNLVVYLKIQSNPVVE